MRISTSINEPFVLSTHAPSQRITTKSKPDRKKFKPSANIFASHTPGRSDGYATVTVQADGVHVLDVSTLHPVASHTLGPSTTFSCPAVTQSTVNGADNIFTTYAAIEASSDLSAEDSGRTIWMWRENLSSSLAERALQKKNSAVMPHLISGLHTSEESPSRILVLSPQADLTILDADMCVKSTRMSPQGCSVLQTFVFPRQSCGFAPTRSAPPRGAVVVLLTASGESTRVQIISVDDADNISESGGCPVSFKPNEIANASCSNTGYLSLLTRDGTWHSLQLASPDGDAVILSPTSEIFRLANLAFISHSRTSTSAEVSLLSLGSSHVLLAATSKPPTQEIILLLWDLQYSVLLASHTMPTPSSLSDSKEVSIRLTLVPTSTSQAFLLLSPSPSPTSDRKSQMTSTPRSTVLVLPFAVPQTSSIANAMGKGATGTKWIITDVADSPSGSAPAPYDAARTKVLTTMRAAMEKNLPQAANVAFFEWEKRERAAGDTTGTAAASEENKQLNSDSHPVLGYAFVKDLLMVVLQPSKPANVSYSSEVVRHLLSRQVVSANMVEGGLLAVLRSKNDWQSIELALRSVLDIPETEIIDCLHVIVRRYRQNELAPDADAMQVDSASLISDIPALRPFLASCVTYATTPAALRVAMRRSLQDADDLLPVVKVLEMWVNQWVKRDVKLLPSKKEVSKNEHGVQVLKVKGKEVNKDLPPFDKVLAFLQTLLDASFITLLQHTPAHRALQTLSAHLEPAIAFAEQLEMLHGPLEPFVRAQAKAVKDGAALGKDGKKREGPVGDWRQRRKMAHEQAGMAVGLYRLEELVL